MKTKLIIIGGFLGAGKTTLLKSASKLLQADGKKVGLITNDQAQGLVDTQMLAGEGIAVQEVSGSCFCCDFDGLMDATLYLRDAGCDIILAEPVGSCTDLSATLFQPIKLYHQQYFELGPLSVLVDPYRIREILGSEKLSKDGSGYIYLKQLEEADYLVVNKADLLEHKEKIEIGRLLKERFPEFPVKWISALKKEGIPTLLESMVNDHKVGTRIADVDYNIYAEGEAKMGWYNAEFVVSHADDLLVQWESFNRRFFYLLQEVFKYEETVVGHVKSYLKNGPSELYANLTDVNGEVHLRGHPFSSTSARFTLNIRAEEKPDLLKEIINDILSVFEDNQLVFSTLVLNCLSPGRPEPKYRLVLAENH